MPTITTRELTTLKIDERYHHTITSRFAIVNYTTEHGIKGAARRFDLDRKTIRAWRWRWQAAGLVGLVPRYPPIRARCIAESTVTLIEHARRDLEWGQSAPAFGSSVSTRSAWPPPRFAASVIGSGIRPSAGNLSGVRGN